MRKIEGKTMIDKRGKKRFVTLRIRKDRQHTRVGWR